MSSALQSWQGEQDSAYKCVFAALSWFAVYQTLCYVPGSLGFAALTLGWERHTQCPTSHPPVLTFSALECGGLYWHVFRSYRLMSLLRHLEPGSKSTKCKRKVLTDVRKFWWSPSGRAGMKDRKYNLTFGVFFSKLLFIYEYIYWLLWCFNHCGNTATWWITINIHLNTKGAVYFSAVWAPAIHISFSWNSVCSAN